MHSNNYLLSEDSIMKKPALQHRAFVGLAKVRGEIERKYSLIKTQAPRILQLTLNEAEAVAWESGFPHLIFPLLAEEKARKAAAWIERQQAVREQTGVFALAA